MNKTITLVFACAITCMMTLSLVVAAEQQNGSSDDDDSNNETELEDDSSDNETDTEDDSLDDADEDETEVETEDENESEQEFERELTDEGLLKIKLKFHDENLESEFEFEEKREGNETKLKIQLSNGRNAEVKIMPEAASETAIARLKIKVCNESNNCTIQLKEIGTGNQTRAAYEIQIERHSRILGIFAAKMQVQAQVDAETGEVIQAMRPWWAFLATESE